MARPKEFIAEEALDAAIAVFERQGYEASSVRDLVQQMGIKSSSLYDTFGDKHALFLAALDRYETQRIERLNGILSAPGSKKAAIRRAFEDVLERSCRPTDPGCLLVNTTVERAAFDPACAERALRNFTDTEDAYLAAVLAAQASGEISSDQDARRLARYLVSSAKGLRVTAKAIRDPEVLRDILETILAALN